MTQAEPITDSDLADPWTWPILGLEVEGEEYWPLQDAIIGHHHSKGTKHQSHLQPLTVPHASLLYVSLKLLLTVDLYAFLT